MSFAVYPQPDACKAWMPTTPLPPSISPPSPPMVCHMPAGHDGQHSNERRPTTLSRRWEGDARPPKPAEVTAPAVIDPRRAAMTAVRDMAGDWYCPFDGERQRINCPECIAAVALDAYEAVERIDHGITS